MRRGVGVRFAATVTAVVAASALVAGCGSSGNTQSHGRIDVVAAENFWGDIAHRVGGDKVAVTSIISDPDRDPHEYESDLSDAAAVERAGVVIVNGAGYDGFMSRLLSAHGGSGRTVLTVAKIVGVTGSNPNPHLWYDPDYVDSAARAIEAELAHRLPADRDYFQKNLATFLAGEQQVVDVIDAIKAKYTGTAIAYTERVPGYLVQAAGLHLGTPASFSQSIEDGTDPSPADNAAFESAIEHHTVKVLLYNGQVTDPETTHLKQLASTSGVPVVGVTETMPPDAKSFQDWQAGQARALLAALGG